jgi:YVTN family beta-propeller protein
MGFRSHSFTRRPKAAVITTAATIVFILFLVTGCGDTFRPVANPITIPGGDPAGIGDAIILASNGNQPGTSSHINVSGDTVVAIQNLQANPVHATIIGGSVVVANYGVFNAGPPAIFGSVSIYPESAGPGASVTTISVGDPNVPPPPANPKAAHAVYVHSTDNTNIYVAEQGEPGGPADALGIIPLSSITGDSQLCTTTNQAPCHVIDGSIKTPVAIVQPPGSGKVYVANAGSGQVTIVDTATFLVRNTITVGSNPQAMVISSDNNCLYVANKGSNSVSVFSTGSDTPTVGTITTGIGSGPSFLFFDKKLQRVYVANSGGNTISIINHAADCSASTSTSVPLGHSSPQSITALADGSRAYAANTDGTVSVILASSNTVKTFSGGANAVSAGSAANPVSIGSSTDGAKVFVANNSGIITIIRTSDDSVVLQFMGPNNPNKLPGAPNPNFVLMF